jgi:hypothetical protein
LDDGDVEPHPGPVNLSTFGQEPPNEYLWIQWIKLHIPERNGPHGWLEQYNLKFWHKLVQKGDLLYRFGKIILNPRAKWNHENYKWTNRAPPSSHRIGMSFTSDDNTMNTPLQVKPVTTIKEFKYKNGMWRYRTGEYQPITHIGAVGPADGIFNDYKLAWALYDKR